MNFVLHPAAEEELGHIIEFIARDSLSVASRVLQEFKETFANLSHNPEMGHRRPELTSRPLRFWIMYRYLIAYDPETKPLTIVMVVHGMRSPRLIAQLLRTEPARR